MPDDMEMAQHLRRNDSLAQVNRSPPDDEQQRQEITVAKISPEAIDEIIRRYKAFPKSESDALDEFRGWLMVLATLTASITWNAALNPPGGFWQGSDEDKGHVAGGSVFRDKNNVRYSLFAFVNLAGFNSSMALLVLLSVNWLFRRTNIMVFSALVSVDLVTLVATFVLGSNVTGTLDPTDYTIIIALVVGSFALVVYLMTQKSRD